MNKLRHTILYILCDFCSGFFSWVIFILFKISKKLSLPVLFSVENIKHSFLVALIFVFLHYLSGYYRDIYRKARLQELWQTFVVVAFASILFFFVFMLDSKQNEREIYYKLFLFYITVLFFLNYFGRLFITTRTINKLNSGKISFNTLIIGGNAKALNLYKDIKSSNNKKNSILGFITTDKNKNEKLSAYLPLLGDCTNLKQIITEQKIDEVLIALETKEYTDLENIIIQLFQTDVYIKVLPTMHDIITGITPVTIFSDSPLVLIPKYFMPAWQENIKRIFDVITSVLALIILFPFFVIIALCIKLTSRGSVLYMQERIGKHGKPFCIYKFRTMIITAEQNGPALSSKNDNRITRVGKFLRKYRIDETPQFVNVLLGHMSIVGPRPERQYYIDQIVQKAPFFIKLLKVKPGITSWGMVKYGYADNVDGMIERLKFDLIYLENMSLYTDFKILIHTILTVIHGKGR